MRTGEWSPGGGGGITADAWQEFPSKRERLFRHLGKGTGTHSQASLLLAVDDSPISSVKEDRRLKTPIQQEKRKRQMMDFQRKM